MGLNEVINHVCNSCNCRELAEHITVRYCRVTGLAAYNIRSQTVIKVSEKVWSKLTTEQRRLVIIHEMCHIVDWYFQNKYHAATDGHGPSWVRYMEMCGIENPQPCIGVYSL